MLARLCDVNDISKNMEGLALLATAVVLCWMFYFSFSIKSHRRNQMIFTHRIRNDPSGSCDNCEPSNKSHPVWIQIQKDSFWLFIQASFKNRNYLYHLMSQIVHFAIFLLCIKFSWHTGCPQWKQFSKGCCNWWEKKIVSTVFQGVSLPFSNNPNTLFPPSLHSWCVWFYLSAVCPHSSALCPSMNTCDRSSPDCNTSKYWSSWVQCIGTYLSRGWGSWNSAVILPHLSPSTFSARGFQLSTSENKCFLKVESM